MVRQVLWMVFSVASTSMLSSQVADRQADPGATRDAPTRAVTLTATKDLLVSGVVPTGNNGYIIVAGNTISRHVINGRRVWTWSHNEPLTDLPYVSPTGTVYVIGIDLLWVGLDLRTGRELWRNTKNGKAGYAQLLPYREDEYLIRVTLGNYREGESDKARGVPDRAIFCKGNRELWTVDVPADATLRIIGDRLFAIVVEGSDVVVHDIISLNARRTPN